MQSVNISYTKPEDLLAAKEKIRITDPERLLIQVFSGVPEEEYIAELLSEIKSSFPGSPVLGATTAGEIVDGEIQDQSTVLNLTQFEKTDITCVLVDQNEDLYHAGEELINTGTGPDTRAVLLFGCGIKNKGAINGEPLLAAFKDHCPGIVVAGGQAGDNAQVNKTFVFTENGYSMQGVAMAALSGNDLQITTDYNLSWVPLGREMIVTAAEGCLVQTIDDRPAKEVYSRYLGENVSARLPASAADFPLVVERSGVMMARHANNVQPDGGLNFMAPFQVGERVRFAYCHSGLVADAARRMFEKYVHSNSEVIFVYSCLSRKWVLGKDTRLEPAPLADQAPMCGFFCYGEYFRGNGSNLFLSQTMTVIGFSESGQRGADEIKSLEPSEFPEHETKQIQHLQALHNLVETTAREREELIEELGKAPLEIKTLRGFIPICANCKKIRDDKGFWNEIELYIQQNTEAQFSHGICPECVRVLYPYIEEEKESASKKADQDKIC